MSELANIGVVAIKWAGVAALWFMIGSITAGIMNQILASEGKEADASAILILVIAGPVGAIALAVAFLVSRVERLLAYGIRGSKR